MSFTGTLLSTAATVGANYLVYGDVKRAVVKSLTNGGRNLFEAPRIAVNPRPQGGPHSGLHHQHGQQLAAAA